MKLSEVIDSYHRATRIPKSEHEHLDVADAVDFEARNGQKPKLEKIETHKFRATQPFVRKKSTPYPGDHPYDPEHADHPIGLKDKKGNVHLVDGHHRVDHAIRKKKSHVHAYTYTDRFE